MVKLLLSFLLLQTVEHVSSARLCANPGWAANGFLNNNRSFYNANEKVTFLCDEHYTTTDRNYALCKDDGLWDSTASPCAVNLAYKAPLTVLTQKVNDSQLVTSKIRVDELTDSDLSTCVDIDRWNHTEIQIQFDQQYEVKGVRIRFNDKDVYNRMDIKVSRIENGQVHEETCEVIDWTRPVYGMVVNCRRPLKGNLIKIYDKVTGGKLSLCDVAVFQKPDESCGTPPQILHGTVDLTKMQNADVAEYQCPEGFDLSHSNKLTCIDGKWQGKPPVCTVKDPCPRLHLKLGFIKYSQTEIDSYFAYQTTATHHCDEGFTLLGNATRTCLIDGTWNNQAVKCVPASRKPPETPVESNVECANPETIPNADVHLNGKSTGALAYFTCRGGNDIYSIECLEDGSWSQINFECPPVSNRDNGNGKESQVGANDSTTIIITVWVSLTILVLLAAVLIGIFFFIKIVRRQGDGDSPFISLWDST